MEIKKIDKKQDKTLAKSELPLEQLKEKDMSAVRGGKVYVCG
jgi:hypothetical protein